MGIESAFQTFGKTVSINTNGTPNTSQSALVRFTDLGLTQAPQALRMINNGTADVWVWISNVTQTAAFPTPGTTTAGTPAYGVRLKPGVIEVFGFNAVNINPNNEQPVNPGFFVNTNSPSATQGIDITCGEGL